MSLIPILTITILIIAGIYITTFTGSKTKINGESIAGMKGANQNPPKELGASCEKADDLSCGSGRKCHRRYSYSSYVCRKTCWTSDHCMHPDYSDRRIGRCWHTSNGAVCM